MLQLEYSYYKDALQSSLIIRLPAGEESGGYQYRMLAANRMEGLLPCTIRHVDGDTLLYYETTGAVPLTALCIRRSLSPGEVKNLLYQLSGVIRNMAAFLLDSDRLLLSPDFVYCSRGAGEEGQFRFVYYPAGTQASGTAHEFYEFLSEKTEMGSRSSARAILSLCELSQEENFILTDALLDPFFEEESVNGAGLQIAPAEEPPENVPGYAWSARTAGNGRIDEERKQSTGTERENVLLWTAEDEAYPAGTGDIAEEEEDGEGNGQNGIRDGNTSDKDKESPKTAIRMIFLLSVLFLVSGLCLTACRVRFTEAFTWTVPVEAGTLTLFLFSAVLSVLGAALALKSDRKELREKTAEEEKKQKEELVETVMP